MVFLDISKAFDKVWHQGLLFKLKSFGIEGRLLCWFGSYLKYRKQRVVINGQASSWFTTNAGVPQGSILGPILFLIFINDMHLSVLSEMRLFADDSHLYDISKNVNSSVVKINNDLALLEGWAKQWRVKFNPTKTIYMIFSRTGNTPDHPNVIFSGTILKESKQHKNLGIVFHNQLSFVH